jgi:phage terminase small subunit
MAKQLSGKQRSWIAYYVGESHFNATDAARRAGYSE